MKLGIFMVALGGGICNYYIACHYGHAIWEPGSSRYAQRYLDITRSSLRFTMKAGHLRPELPLICLTSVSCCTMTEDGISAIKLSVRLLSWCLLTRNEACQPSCLSAVPYLCFIYNRKMNQHSGKTGADRGYQYPDWGQPLPASVWWNLCQREAVKRWRNSRKAI